MHTIKSSNNKRKPNVAICGRRRRWRWMMMTAARVWQQTFEHNNNNNNIGEKKLNKTKVL